MRHVLALIFLALLLPLGQAKAQCTVPFVFVNNTQIVANQVNSDFNAVTGCVNTSTAIASIAALRLNTTTVTSLTVSGYAIPGDGGGGVFSYNSTDTITPDNGGTVIVDGLGHRWYRQYAGGVDPRWFGAKADCATNDGAAFQAAMTYIATLSSNGGNGYAVDFSGRCLVTNQKITATGNGLTVRNGELDAFSGFADTMLVIKGQYDEIHRMACDGGKTADCFDLSQNNFGVQVSDSQWQHTPNFGLKVSMGGGLIHGNLGTQWLKNDPEFIVQADYTARVLWLLDADGRVSNNIMHNGLYPLACGDDVSTTCGTMLFINNHFYNGTVPFNPGTGLINPIAVHIGVGSSELKFVNTYIDNGTIDSFTASVTFDGLILNQNGLNRTDAWIRFTATSAGQALGSVICCGPTTVAGTGTASTFMFALVEPGGTSWSTNKAFLNAFAPGQISMSNGSRTIYTSSASTTVIQPFVGSATKGCIDLTANFVGAVPSEICQNNANDLELWTSGALAYTLTSQGAPAWKAGANTCNAGCGTSPVATFTGGNVLGTIALGGTPSTTVVVNFVPAWSGNAPICQVWQPGNRANLLTSTPTTATLTFTVTSAALNQVYNWKCEQIN